MYLTIREPRLLETTLRLAVPSLLTLTNFKFAVTSKIYFCLRYVPFKAFEPA